MNCGSIIPPMPVTCKGKRLFVKAMTAGSELAVEVLNKAGDVIAGFTTEQCHAFCGNSTCAEKHRIDEHSKFLSGVHQVRQGSVGKQCHATPDGRKAGEPFPVILSPSNGTVWCWTDGYHQISHQD